MSIKKEQEIKNKITCKGILLGVDDAGLHVQDEKSLETEVLSYDDLKMFEGKTINFTVAESTKREIDEEIDEE